MQTFLPHPNFAESAKCLDYRRLGKQRVEVLILLNSLFGKTTTGWKNHPCREMWRGYEQALVVYGLAICTEWKGRGYKDTCYEKINTFSKGGDLIVPPWVGREDIHLSHKSNLIRKYPEHYKPLWQSVPDNLPYIWPIENNT